MQRRKDNYSPIVIYVLPKLTFLFPVPISDYFPKKKKKCKNLFLEFCNLYNHLFKKSDEKMFNNILTVC